MTELSVVIVSYNNCAFLARCIGSLAGEERVKEIIVVDNASNDGTVERLKASGTSQHRNAETSQDRLKLIENERNVGFAAACNIGYRNSSAPYVLFLNPDCVVEPQALDIICGVFDRNPNVGMAGPMLLNPDGSEQRGGRRRIPTLVRVFARKTSSRGFEQHQEPVPEGPVPVEAISGAFMCVRRTAVAKVGLLDEGYFMHAEDLDWCVRFREKGWDILFVPQARVVHVKGVSSRTRVLAVHWHMHRSLQRFYNKFLATGHSPWLRWLVILGIWLRFVLLLPLALARSLWYRIHIEPTS